MNEVADHKWGCGDCDSIMPGTALLVGEVSFDPGETVYGCPSCRGLSLFLACDEPGCTATVSCGTPTPTGYRSTCGRHKPSSPDPHTPKRGTL